MALTSRLIEEGIDPSVGSVGDALDNAMAETTVGSFKTELIRRQGPWRDVDQVELATAEWVEWFNTERPHNELDDFTPEEVERPLRSQTRPAKSRLIQHVRPPDSPGRLTISGPILGDGPTDVVER